MSTLNSLSYEGSDQNSEVNNGQNQPGLRPSFFKRHLGLMAVLTIYFVLTAYTGWRLPLSTGPDEVAHFMYARFIGKEHSLALTETQREAAGYKSDQPPLYAALVGLTYWQDLAQPPFVKMTHNVPRRHLINDGVVDRQGTNRFFGVVNSEEPLAGEVLFWHYGRLLSTVFGGLTLIVIYGIARKTFAGQSQPHLWATATVMSLAFVPTFIFMSAVFSYETLLGLWLALYLLTAVYLLKGSAARWLYLLAGLWVGLAIVTKLAALPALVSLVGLIWLVGYRAKWPVSTYLARLALGAAGLLLGVGWWIFLIERQFNRVAELGWVGGLLYPILVGDGSGEGTSAKVVDALAGNSSPWLIWFSQPWQILNWGQRLFDTFWATQITLPRLGLQLLMVLTLCSVIGLAVAWWRNQADRAWLGFLLFHAALFFILPLGRFLVSRQTGIAGQGHHVLLPGSAAFALLLTWGLATLLPGKKWLGGIVVGGLLLLWMLTYTMRYQPPSPVPVRTVPPTLPITATAAEVDFGPLALAGYELKGLDESGSCCDQSGSALGVFVYWVAQELTTEDYVATLRLVDGQGQPHAVWRGYGANGRYPSRAWEPGDIVRDELWLPVAGLAAGSYNLTLQIAPEGTEPSRDPLELTKVKLGAPPSLPAQAKVVIWHEGQATETPPPFAQRSTIQVTSLESVHLVGPDQVLHKPDQVAGTSQVFVVKPLWPNGLYHFQVDGSGPKSTLVATVQVADFQRQTTIPASQFEVQVNFANQVALLGYDLPQQPLSPGQPISLGLNWQALRTPQADFINFVRLRDEKGQEWGGYDRLPQEAYSTLLWTAGEVVSDGLTLLVPADAPPGRYYVEVGFYLPIPQSLVYLPIVKDGQASDLTSVTLGPLEIVAENEGDESGVSLP